MVYETIEKVRGEPVRQFSVFTENRMGRLHDIIALFGKHDVHVLAVTALDTTDSAILRLVVDGPERARELLTTKQYPFTESELLAVEIDSATQLKDVLGAMLEAEINIHYLYSFLTRPHGKSAVALHVEEPEVATQALLRHHFRLLDQSDISR
jgi:hypothetical protein